mgnify:CR=1 FL=1
MALEEKISKHLGKPYVYIKDQKKFLCSNGVLFTLEEYRDGIDINAEYERRAKEDMLYDYAYAKSTGLLRKKRGYSKMLLGSSTEENEAFEKIVAENPSVTEQKRNGETVPKVSEDDTNGLQHKVSERKDTSEVRQETEGRNGNSLDRQEEKQGFSVMFIVALLGFTSLISGYISTLHTATYLYDYVDVFSAWLMSASVTAYNATAFEVSVIFKSKRRFGLAFIFITLWAMVTLFSMATTVSVFYDRFNFIETQIALENKQSVSNKLALELLQKKESDLRESIEFKKKDIEYRQEKDYATTAVRTELNELQEELQKNLSEQQLLLQETPEVTEKTTKRKESLFAFLGRLMKIEGGVLEFIMSTMSAIFINIISPMSLVAVAEIKTKKKRTLD